MRFSIKARIPRSAMTRERVFPKREACLGGLNGLYESKQAKNWLTIIFWVEVIEGHWRSTQSNPRPVLINKEALLVGWDGMGWDWLS